MQSKLRHVSLLWLEGGAFTHHLAQWLKLCTTEHKVSGSILSSGNFLFFMGLKNKVACVLRFQRTGRSPHGPSSSIAVCYGVASAQQLWCIKPGFELLISVQNLITTSKTSLSEVLLCSFTKSREQSFPPKPAPKRAATAGQEDLSTVFCLTNFVLRCRELRDALRCNQQCREEKILKKRFLLMSADAVGAVFCRVAPLLVHLWHPLKRRLQRPPFLLADSHCSFHNIASSCARLPLRRKKSTGHSVLSSADF